jgi:hypothetical protein
MMTVDLREAREARVEGTRRVVVVVVVTRRGGSSSTSTARTRMRHIVR